MVRYRVDGLAQVPVRRVGPRPESRDGGTAVTGWFGGQVEVDLIQYPRQAQEPVAAVCGVDLVVLFKEFVDDGDLLDPAGDPAEKDVLVAVGFPLLDGREE